MWERSVEERRASWSSKAGRKDNQPSTRFSRLARPVVRKNLLSIFCLSLISPVDRPVDTRYEQPFEKRYHSPYPKVCDGMVTFYGILFLVRFETAR